MFLEAHDDGPLQKILICRSAFPHRVILIGYVNAFGLLMGRHNQTDHVIKNRIRCSNVTGVLLFMGDGCDSRHCLMVEEVRSLNEKTRLLMEIFNLKKLNDVQVQERYSEKI
jgi:altronate dehydratase